MVSRRARAEPRMGRAQGGPAPALCCPPARPCRISTVQQRYTLRAVRALMWAWSARSGNGNVHCHDASQSHPVDSPLYSSGFKTPNALPGSSAPTASRWRGICPGPFWWHVAAGTALHPILPRGTAVRGSVRGRATRTPPMGFGKLCAAQCHRPPLSALTEAAAPGPGRALI